MKDTTSDEIHLQAAMRHHEEAAFLPWQAMAPDEELMLAEEGDQSTPRRGWMLKEVLAYLFGDKDPMHWQNKGMRAVAIFWHCLPGLLVGRDMSELETIRRQAVIVRGFNLEEFVRLSADEEWREMLKQVMNFIFPPRKEWIKRGCLNAFLLARAYNPELVMIEIVRDGKRRRVDMNYETIEEIFEGSVLLTREERDRARAKMSARAQVLLRHPVEQAGGVAHIRFGKSASARAGMAESAKRTCNRRRAAGEGSAE